MLWHLDFGPAGPIETAPLFYSLQQKSNLAPFGCKYISRSRGAERVSSGLLSTYRRLLNHWIDPTSAAMDRAATKRAAVWNLDLGQFLCGKLIPGSVIPVAEER